MTEPWKVYSVVVDAGGIRHAFVWHPVNLVGVMRALRWHVSSACRACNWCVSVARCENVVPGDAADADPEPDVDCLACVGLTAGMPRREP